MAAADYAWAEAADELLSALTITLVQPDDGSAIQALEPRSQYPTLMTFEQALDAAFALPDFAYGGVIVQTDALGGWDALVEPAGWASSDPDRLVALSANGTAVSVFWNVNADMSFGLARAGSLVRFFDPLLYNEAEALPEEGDFQWGPRQPRAGALALMERLTGVRIPVSGCWRRRVRALSSRYDASSAASSSGVSTSGFTPGTSTNRTASGNLLKSWLRPRSVSLRVWTTNCCATTRPVASSSTGLPGWPST